MAACRAGWLVMLRAALVPREARGGCSGGSLVKWCWVGSQVGFGCDFTPASYITRVFSAFFSGLEMLHLNWGVAHVDGCPSSRMSRDSSRPWWVLDFQAWELGMIPLQQKGWHHHCSLLPHHFWVELLVGYPKEEPQPQTS